MASTINTMPVSCAGGLDLRSTTQELMEKPGYATSLINFEQSLSGGYRRISGYYPVGDGTVWEIPVEPEPEPEPSLCVTIKDLFSMEVGDIAPCVGSIHTNSGYGGKAVEQHWTDYEFTVPDGYNPVIGSGVFSVNTDFVTLGSFTLGGLHNSYVSSTGLEVQVVESSQCSAGSQNPSPGTSGYSIADAFGSDTYCYAPINYTENVSCPAQNFFNYSELIACGDMEDPYAFGDYTTEYAVDASSNIITSRDADPSADLRGEPNYFAYDVDNTVYRVYPEFTTKPCISFCRQDNQGVYVDSETGEILHIATCEFSPQTGGPL